MSVLRRNYRFFVFTVGTFLLLTYGFIGCQQEQATANADKVDFNYAIRPILVQKCFLCHGPDPNSRKANLRLDTYEGATALMKNGSKAIDPGHAANSKVFYRINHKDPDIMMPTPESNLKLTPKEISLIEKWINQGAEWKPHWAFIAPKASEGVKKYNGNPIDYFINQKLAENELKPSDEADKNSLIRRVSYTLTGLPPTPEALNQFINDKSTDAYPKMVDQYLQSPHFGEHWARHWMDLVRYAETKGHEFDYTISGAWRYRDYLIRAFNDDVPYPQMVREQLAGDLLPHPRINPTTKINESDIGTVFYTLAEGTHSPVDVRKDEADRIDNMIDVTSKAFQALTISCARCHDHKFDPIGTKDYYSLYGVMEGTRFSPIPAKALETAEKVHPLQLINDSIRTAVLEEWMKKQHPVTASNAQFAGYKQPSTNPEDTLIGDFSHQDLNGWKSDGLAFTNNTTLGDPIFNEKNTLVALQEGKASSRRLSTNIFGALRSPDFILNKNFIGVKAAGKKSSIRIIIDNFQLIQYPIYGNMDQRVDTSNFINFVFDVAQWKGHKAYIEVVPGIYDNHVFKLRKDAWIEVKYAIGYNKDWFEPAQNRSSVTNPAAVINAMLTNNGDNNQIRLINAMLKSKRIATQFPALEQQLQLKNQYQQAFTDSVEFLYGVTEGFGKNSPVFVRGSHKSLSAEPVPRRFLPVLKVSNPDCNVTGSGRLELAAAINDPQNTLTSRVMVNRIWYYLFGKGIVETVDNFGMQGKLPSHPELLDHLAIQFQKDNQSIKKTIKTILLSDVFKRSVKPRGNAKENDPTNIYLSHYPIRRLEAESIRDAILASSGKLDTSMFGKPVKAFISIYMNGRGKPSKSGPLDGNGRRSIYVEVRRNFLDPMMMTFDRPIPFTAFGKRTVTNVPSQSLMLLNDPFVLEQADVMAQNLLLQKDKTFESCVQWIYQRCLSRKASSYEIEEADDFMQQLKKNYNAKGIKNQVTLMIWKDYIHSVFNFKEFIYLN